MDQINSLIAGLSLKQRISIVAAALAVVAGMRRDAGDCAAEDQVSEREP